jgi:hypothetical protein
MRTLLDSLTKMLELHESKKAQILNRLNGKEEFETEIPLLLSMCLEGSKTPADTLDVALDLRKSAGRLRRKISEFPKERGQASKEFAELVLACFGKVPLTESMILSVVSEITVESLSDEMLQELEIWPDPRIAEGIVNSLTKFACQKLFEAIADHTFKRSLLFLKGMRKSAKESKQVRFLAKKAFGDRIDDYEIDRFLRIRTILQSRMR